MPAVHCRGDDVTAGGVGEGVEHPVGGVARWVDGRSAKIYNHSVVD